MDRPHPTTGGHPARRAAGRTARVAAAAALVVLASAVVAVAQDPFDDGGGPRLRFGGGRIQGPARDPEPDRFELVRVRYDSVGSEMEAYYYYRGRVWHRWETDFPEAEVNFGRRVAELSRVRTSPFILDRRLIDDDIFDYPFLIMSDVGWMTLDDTEIARLREFLLRGGFLWADDFWGDAEWQNFEDVMRRVLPDVVPREVPLDHALLHTVFDVYEVPLIPARDFATPDGRGREREDFHRHPVGDMQTAHLRGWLDAAGRPMVIATHNTDVGDGFERQDYGQWYFERYSTRAYQLGLNVVVYALLH